MTLEEIKIERKKVRDQMVALSKTRNSNQTTYDKLKKELFRLDWLIINLKEKENEKNE